MGFWDRLFGPRMKSEKLQTFQELGTYTSIFRTFGGDIYKSDLVRSCIRPLADISSKANARCTVARVEKILNKPNKFMNGHDFVMKVRTYLEVKNTVFILIIRDDRLRPVEYYPIPYRSFEAMEDGKGDLYIKFAFTNYQHQYLTFPFADLAVLRKDYLYSDISGEDNAPIIQPLDVINITQQGVGNAVKATSNLRGILKSTKAMLHPEDIKKNKETFVKDYLNLENEGGIASLDSTQEFIPIKMEPAIASAEQMREFRENIFRYFGVNDKIIMGTCTEAEFEIFYENRIEPFLIALSEELTNKSFPNGGATIIYESNKLQFASTNTKLGMVQLVDRGLMTPNEYRVLFNMAPYEGGDEFVLRLDTAKTGDNTQSGSDNSDDSNKENNDE